MRALARGAAGLIAIALLAAVWIGIAWALLVLLISAHGPDPRAADGDPCCAYPDNWGEVAAGVALGVVLVAITASLIHVAITLAGFAIKGERPKLLPRQRVFATLATVAAAFAVYMAVVFAGS
jgi:hypothetical protein